jgi:PAS domain S-box-containing protein
VVLRGFWSGPRRTGNVRRLILFYGAFVAVLAALGLYVGLRGLRLNLAEAESRTKNAAQALQQHMLRAMEATDLTLLRVADHHAVRDLAAAARSREEHLYLTALLGRLPHLRALWVFDASGRLLLDSAKFPAPPLEVPAREAFAWARSTDRAGLHVGDPVPGKFTGRPLFTVSRRIVGRSGELMGLVSAVMEPGYFEDFHRAIPLGAHGEIALFKTDGALLDGRPRPEDALGSPVLYRRALEEIAGGAAQGTYRAVEGGVERLVSFRRLERLPLAVTAAYTLRDIRQEVAADLFTPSLGILVCFLFVSGFFAVTLRNARREDALHAATAERELLFRSVINNAGAGIVLVALDGTARLVNSRFAVMLGYEPEELAGLDALGLVHPEDRPEVTERLAEFASGHTVIYSREIRCLHKNGEAVWVAVSATLKPAAETQDRREQPEGPRQEPLIVAVTTDITRRKQAEAALQESRKTTQALLDAALESALLLDTAGVVLALNEKAAAAIGRPPQQAIGRPLDELFAPDQALPLLAGVREVAAQKRPILFQERRAGQSFDTSIHPVFDAEGSVARLAVYSLDTTERDQALDGLRKAEEKYRTIFHNAPLGIYRASLEGRFLEANPRLARMLGYESPAELLARVTDIARDVYADPERRRDVLARIHETPGLVTLEGEFLRRDGSIFTANLNLTLIRDGQGSPLFIEGMVEDITARKAAEEALTKSSAVLKETQRLARLGGFEVEAASRAFRCTDEIFELLEADPTDALSLEALVGRFTPEHRPTLVRAVDAAFAQGWPFDLTLKLTTAAGQPMWARVVGRMEGEGSPERLVGTLQDVTSLKLAEEAVKKSEQTYRTLLNVLPYGVVELDLTGAILYNNQALRRITGHVEGELAGSTVFELQTSQAERQSLRALLARAAQTEPESKPWQGRFFTKHGRVIDVEVAWDYKRDETGRATGLIAVVTDITARKQAEEELRQSEFRLRTVADFTFDWEFWIRRDMRFEYVSPSCERLCGYPAEDFFRDHELFTRIVLPDDREIFLAGLAQGFASPSPGEVSYRILHKNGGVRWLALGYQPVIDPDGAPSGLRGSIRDVTAEREAQALREDVERITRHDLKSPLMTAMLIPKLLMRRGPLNPGQLELLKELEVSSSRMLNTINSSLALYKIETGTYELRPQPIDILALLRRVAAELAPALEPKGAGVDILLAGRPAGESDAAVIQGEESLCYSLFENLLKNAVEAAPQATRITVRLDAALRTWIAAIHNQGAVPAEIRERFFEKYATAGKRYGTGLGTYTAKLIAETHGGEISMTTSEQSGTTVSVRLPAEPLPLAERMR